MTGNQEGWKKDKKRENVLGMKYDQNILCTCIRHHEEASINRSHLCDSYWGGRPVDRSNAYGFQAFQVGVRGEARFALGFCGKYSSWKAGDRGPWQLLH